MTRGTASSRSIRPWSTSCVGDAERRAGGALADAGLQHPQLAALDGELDVAQVAVVVLQRLHDVEQLVVGRLVDPLEVLQRERVADAGDDVLALGVLQVVAVDALLPEPGSRVKATPVPESMPRLPNTIEQTLTAVPRSAGMRSWRR